MRRTSDSGPLRWSLGVGAVAAVFFQFVVKSFEADAEEFRGAGFVVPGGAERLQNELAFHGVDGGADGKLDGRKVARTFRSNLAEFGRERRAGDEIFFAHDGGALENVAEFADISWPGVP